MDQIVHSASHYPFPGTPSHPRCYMLWTGMHKIVQRDACTSMQVVCAQPSVARDLWNAEERLGLHRLDGLCTGAMRSPTCPSSGVLRAAGWRGLVWRACDCPHVHL
jgi:hypothetical protein